MQLLSCNQVRNILYPNIMKFVYKMSLKFMERLNTVAEVKQKIQEYYSFYLIPCDKYAFYL